MKILVTGYRGFIGSHLLKRLKASYGDDVFTFDRNQDIQHTIKVIRPDVVFHLAGNPLIKTSDASGLVNDNTILTHRILESMDGGRIIFSSSGVVYGDSPSIGSEYYETSATLPTSLYGYTKLASENLIQAYTITGKIQSTIFRLIANVGPGATHGVVKDLVAKYHKNEVLEVLGDHPGSYKPYLYIDDTIDALMMGMEKPLDGIYNLAPFGQLYINDIVELIFQRYGEKEVAWLGAGSNWKGDNKIVGINTDKLRQAGWASKYTSEEAVNATLRG